MLCSIRDRRHGWNLVPPDFTAQESCRMSTIAEQEETGLKEPLRTLLILLGGFIMALVAFAGQIDSSDDYRGEIQDSQRESRAALVDSTFQEKS